jgi:hypothetical protein
MKQNPTTLSLKTDAGALQYRASTREVLLQYRDSIFIASHFMQFNLAEESINSFIRDFLLARILDILIDREADNYAVFLLT